MSVRVKSILIFHFLLGFRSCLGDSGHETKNIVVVHDSWYKPGTDAYYTVMTKTLLDELMAITPGVRLTEVAITARSHKDIYRLVYNEVTNPSGVIVLGSCLVQKAMHKYGTPTNSSTFIPSGSVPVLFVSHDICRGISPESHNLIILSEIHFQNWFNCLAYVMRAWLKTFIRTASFPLNNRLRLNVSYSSKKDFVAMDMMFKCSSITQVGNSLLRTRQRLKGKTLKVVTINRPPFVFLTLDDNGVIVNKSGFAIEMLEHLRKKFKFQYTLELPYDGNWGTKMDNGTWNGMVGMVHRHEVNMGVGPFTISLAREEAIDFTFPYFVEPSALLTPKPGPVKRIFAFLDPFTLEVWLSILLSIVILGPIMNVLTKAQGNVYLYPHSETAPGRGVTVWGQYWTLAGALLQQGMSYPMSSASRVVFGGWITAIIALSCAYTGVLISFLTVPRIYNPINSLADLPLQTTFKWTFRKGTAHQSLFMDKEATGIYAQIGKPFQSNTDGLALTNSDGIARVVRGTHVFIKEKSFLEFAMEADFLNTGECNLDIAKAEFFPAGMGWIMQNGDPLQKLFSKEFILMDQTGLLRKWRTKYWPRPNKCTASLKNRSFMLVLDVFDLAGPFIILGCGFFSGLIFLISECCWRKRKKKILEEPVPISKNIKQAFTVSPMREFNVPSPSKQVGGTNSDYKLSVSVTYLNKCGSTKRPGDLKEL